MAKARVQKNSAVPKSKLLQKMNPAQTKAANFGDGPLLIVAGAGTGKTTVITRRIAHLIEQDVKPDQILALTFTEKAAAEMEERVDLLLPYGYYDLWISTFHAFCERILKQHALDIGVPNDFKLVDTVQQWVLVRENLERFNLEYYKPLGNPTKFISALIKHFSKLKDEEISPQEYIDFAEKQSIADAAPEFDAEEEIARIRELANAYDVYQKLLLENSFLDFGDLINYTLRLFRERKNILAFYQNKFKFVLVDEFQDTNYAQYELIKMLGGQRKNINVVGDDDQSIYKFRGASVSNIMQFKKDYPDAQEITLTENYRSAQNILDMSYAFIQANNPDRLEPKLGINKKLTAATKEEGEIAILSGQALEDEVDLVTKKIQTLHNGETTWNDFAILVRANDQAEIFINKLAQLNIPYTFFANKGLYKKRIISDLIAYMRLLMDLHDSSLMYRVLNFPNFRIDHADMANLMNYGHKKTLTLYESLQQSAMVPEMQPQSAKRIAELLNILRVHSEEAAAKNAVEAFITIVRGLRIADRVNEDTYENFEDREILEQFYKRIEQFEVESIDKSLKAFLDRLQYEQDAGEEGKINFDPNSGPESVKILTVHSSKGLEFKNVFVVNMVNLRFPSTDRKEAIEIPRGLIKEVLPDGDVHLQEERRLFYVAMTRAKRGLYFSYAADYGGQRAKKPSQFLMDVGLVAKPEKSLQLERQQVSRAARPIDKNLILPKRFSYTQINEFRRCPLAYKYKYVLHLPIRGNQHLSFGNTIHLTLDKFLKEYRDSLNRIQPELFPSKNKDKLPDISELLELYEQNWIDEWYESSAQKEGMRKRGIEILHAFYEEFKREPKAPKYLEKSFLLKLGGFDFTGKIDRADVDESGALQIIDYKTGERKLDKKSDRHQLLIYQWAAEEYLKEKVSSMRYWYLFHKSFSDDAIGTPEEIEKLKEELLEDIDKIRQATLNDSFKELDKKTTHDCQFHDLD